MNKTIAVKMSPLKFSYEIILNVTKTEKLLFLEINLCTCMQVYEKQVIQGQRGNTTITLCSVHNAVGSLGKSFHDNV